MKKIILSLSVLMFASPAFTQVGRAIMQSGFRSVGSTQSSMALKVGQKVGQEALAHTSAISLVPITNWVGQPFIQVRTIENNIIPSKNFPVPPSASTAEVLDWKTAAQYIFPAGRYGHEAYIPTSSDNSQGRYVFRGLPIRRLDELKNLLVNGMERSKTASYFNGIYVADHVTEALGHSVPWGALYPSLPVIVRISNTPELSAENPMEWRTPFTGVFHKDIKPRFMDIWVFLKVNGNPGWYHVISVDNEMVFIPAMGTPVSW